MATKTQSLYDVIIIGAGLAGLAAACLLSKKGKKVLVLEKHNQAGGYATNFSRSGYEFDVALHSFDGMCPGSYSYRIIEELGIADQIEFIAHKRLYRLLLKEQGIDLKVKHGDIDAYIDQLATLFPSERLNLQKLFAKMQDCHHHVGKFLFGSKPFWWRFISVPLVYRNILRYEKCTVDQFLSYYIQDEALKRIITCQWSYYGLPAKSLAYGHFGYPTIDYLNNGGYAIRGGSQNLSNALVDKITAQGGKVLLSSVVKKIIPQVNHSYSVETKKRGAFGAKALISNISPYQLVDLMGRDSFSNNYLDKLTSLDIATSGIQVYLGLGCSDKQLGIDTDDTIIFVPGAQQNQDKQFKTTQSGQILSDATNFSINLFSNVDSSLVPEGTSSMGLFSLMGGSSWQSGKKSDYRIRKQQITEHLLARAETIIPGLSRHISVIETGSPRTMNHFTRNTQGSIYGFAQTVDQNGLFRRFPQKYPMKNLFQVGQWTFPGGGYIAVLASAKILIDRYF